MTFPQHIAVTMATAVLRVATGVRASDEEGRSEDQRWRERERKNKEGCQRAKWAKVRREEVDVREREGRRDGVQGRESVSTRDTSMSEPQPGLLGETAAAS